VDIAEARMRWHKDIVDQWCDAWASQRRRMLGITELLPRDRLGQLRSTLGALRSDREGAGQGIVTQSFPEVYIGPGPNYPLLVNRAWKIMDRRWREIVEVHYVITKDADGRTITVKEKAGTLEMSVRLYWHYLTYGKNFIHSFVTVSTSDRDPEFEKSVCTQKTPAFP
jgi:hypothetical protein